MTVLFTDSGAGADANPIGGSYVTVTGVGAIRRLGNQLANASGSDGDHAAYVDITTPNDCYCQVRNPVVGGRDGGPVVRAQPGAMSLLFFTDYNATDVEAYIFVSGSPTLKDRDAGTYNTNSILRFEVVGTTYTTKIDGATINSFTDATFSSGKCGVFMYDSALRFDQVEIGDFLTAALPVYSDRTGTRANRPGRGPYSRGRYKRPAIDAFPVVVPTVFVPVDVYSDRTGTRENRPGRGPYSRGRYFVRTRLDVVQFVSTYNESLSETASSSDALAGVAEMVGALSESASAAESFAGLLEALGALSEAGAATDTDSAANTAVGSLVETSSAADTKSGTLIAVAALTEAASGTDSLSSTTGNDSLLSESANATDSVSSVLTAVGVLTESGSAADLVSSIATLIAQLSESGSGSESLDGSIAGSTYNVSIAETASSSDAITGALLAAAAIAESGSATDAHSTLLHAAAVLIEGGSAADTLPSQLVGLGSLAEVATAIDSVTTSPRVPPRGNRLIVVSASTRRITIRPN